MSKFLLKINDVNDIYPRDNLGYILGIDKYSICFNNTFSLDEIEKIVSEHKETEFFVSLNKVIYEEELEEYEYVLKKLDKIGLKGIIVGDLAALTYNLTTTIIIDQLHLNNSYLSINHYYNKNGCGVMLTNDITMDEINEIRANTKAILLKQVFGHVHLSSSVRSLITNYLTYFNIKDSSKINYIKEGNSSDEFIIKEEEFGTHILTSKILDLFEEKGSINCDYLVIDSYLIDNEVIKDVVNAYLQNDVKLIDDVRKRISITKGFIETKTMYKVKHYE